MNITVLTPLSLRPLDVRMNVAYIIDTILDTPACDPDNTVTRLFSDGVHVYGRMWGRIQTIYNTLGWGKLSDREINDIYKSMISVTTKFRGIDVTPMQIMGTKQRWDNNGWTRYETKRNGRREFTRRYGYWGVTAVGLCFGVALPQN